MSSTTTNLQMTKPGTEDPVNISVLNTNFDLLDALGVDYIKSYETLAPRYTTVNNYWPIIGNWFVRKWKSGYVELHGVFSYTKYAASSTNGEMGLYLPANLNLSECYSYSVTAGQYGNTEGHTAYANFIPSLSMFDVYIREHNTSDSVGDVYFALNLYGKLSS